MFLKVLYPTKEESKAIKNWCSKNLLNLISQIAQKLSFIFFYIVFYALIMCVIGLITYLVALLIKIDLMGHVTNLISYQLNQHHYLKVAFLILSLGTALYFPLLMCYCIPKGIYQTFIGIIKLILFTFKSSKQLYVERKEAMLPQLEKDQLEKSVNVNQEFPKKKVKL